MYLIRVDIQEKRIRNNMCGIGIDLKDLEAIGKELNERNKEMIINTLNNEGFSTSSIKDLSYKCNIKDSKMFNNLIKICEAEDLIIKINKSMLVSTYNMSLLKDKLTIFFETHSSINVSEFKNLLKVSRKYAIPILEYLDKINFTYRQENERKKMK